VTCNKHFFTCSNAWNFYNMSSGFDTHLPRMDLVDDVDFCPVYSKFLHIDRCICSRSSIFQSLSFNLYTQEQFLQSLITFFSRKNSPIKSLSYIPFFFFKVYRHYAGRSNHSFLEFRSLTICHLQTSLFYSDDFSCGIHYKAHDNSCS